MDTQELEAYRKAGRIAQTCLREGALLIRPGADLREVLDAIELRIFQMGGKPAFPAQVSLNEVAAHFCPSMDDALVFKEGDLVKLDIGVHIDGRIADNALTVSLGGDHDAILAASRDALAAALPLARPGVSLHEIGTAIHHAIDSYGLSPIRNLSGHGLAPFQIHAPPSIPNIPTGDKTTLKEGMVIAIEPFATNGKGLIYEGNNPTLFTLVKPGPVRSPLARELLPTLKAYEGLPFAQRWVERKHGVGKTRLGLQELYRAGCLVAHPPLPEQAKGLVSQHEHSVIIGDKPFVFTRQAEDD